MRIVRYTGLELDPSIPEEWQTGSWGLLVDQLVYPLARRHIWTAAMTGSVHQR